MAKFTDGYKNLNKKIGTKDGFGHGTIWSQSVISDEELGNMYDSNGLLNLIITAPVKDAFLTGINSTNDAIVKLYSDISSKIGEAISLSRAYGGAYIYKEKGNFIVLSIEDVHTSTVELNPLREDFLLPKSLNIVATGEEIDMEQIIHVIQHGTNRFKAENNGVGVPITTKVIEAIIRYGVGMSQAIDILGELNQNVIKMQDLNTVLQDDGDSDLMERLELINTLKSNNSILLLDREDEYINVSKSLSGVRDIILESAVNVCALAKIPYARLFSKPQSTIGASDKGDLINYYDTVVSDIRMEFIKPIFDEILEARGIKGEWCFEDIYSDSQVEKVEARGKEIDNVAKLLELGLIDENQALKELDL